MAGVTIHTGSGAQKNKICHCFHFYPHLFAMKWWDWMLWSSFFQCWVLSQLFHSLLSPASRGSLAKDREAYSDQRVSIRISDVRTLQVGLSIQKSHPCDTCNLIFKGILQLAGQQGAPPGQQPYLCKSCGKALWFSVNLDQIQRQRIYLSVESQSPEKKRSGHPLWIAADATLGKACMCREHKEDFLAGSGLVQNCATHNWENPYKSAEC